MEEIDCTFILNAQEWIAVSWLYFLQSQAKFSISHSHFCCRLPFWSLHSIVCISDSSVQFSCSVMCDALWPHELQHARLPCPSQTPEVYSNPCPSSWWCHPSISPSVVPFSSFPQSLPASGSFPVSQLFTWGGQSTGVSASASVLPMNTQGWSPLGWTGWISLQSKGLSRVFSRTTVQKHQFFGTQLSSQSHHTQVQIKYWDRVLGEVEKRYLSWFAGQKEGH